MRRRGRIVSAAFLSTALLIATRGANADGVRASGRSEASPVELVRDRWGIEQGLPQSSITAIHQGRDGYLWLATFGGLVRFDGVRFREFSPANSPGLTTPRLLAIAEDAAGAIYVATEDRGVLRYREGRFETIATPEELGGGLAHDLAMAPDGALWVATDGSVARVEGDRVQARFDLGDDLPGDAAFALVIDPSGRAWIGTNGGLAAIENGRVESFASRGGKFAEPVLAIATAPDGGLWTLSPEAVLRVENGVVTRELPRFQGTDLSGALGIDGEGRVWVGGTELEMEDGARLEHIAAAEELGGRNFRAIQADREGSVWIGTDGGGLHRFRPARARTLTAADGIPAGSVTTVIQDRHGALWTGSLCDGVSRSTNGRFEPVVREGGQSFGCVFSLYVDRDDALWVGNHELVRWDGKTSRTYGVESGMPTSGAHAILRDRAGTLWIGTEDGLARKEGERIVLLDENEALPDRRVRALHESRDGALWVATAGGLARYRDGRVESYLAGRELPAAAARALYEDDGGALWIGTYGGGLARLRDGKFARATTDDGLAENVVSAIVEDGLGNFWLSGNRGLSRIPRRELEALLDGRIARTTPLVLRARDGMLSAECNGGSQPSSWLAADGRLYFPTVKGLVVVDPARLARNQNAPPVVVEEVRIGSRVVDSGGRVEVRPGRGDVEIAYTALSFLAPGDLRFRYRLTGLDADWVDAGNRRVAWYTNVPPGRYRFEVAAANEDGVWSATPAARSFRFHPRFYQKPWFRALAALSLVVFGAAFQLLRLERSRRHAEALERQVAERTADLRAEQQRTEQHVVLLQRQDEDLKALNRNLSKMVSEQTATLVETRDAAVLTLARLAELRDGTTGEHLDRIAAYTRRLAQAIATGRLGPLDEELIERVARSSPLHDIGKVAIPDSILKKPGPLTEEERAIMRTHTTIGGDTLRSVMERYGSQGFLAMATEIAYSHHERWDGRGYPQGRSGLEIPLSARIVAIVDVFDALTSVRPYKSAVSHEETVAIIAAERGAHFDPDLVDAFLAIHHEFPGIRSRLAA